MKKNHSLSPTGLFLMFLFLLFTTPLVVAQTAVPPTLGDGTSGSPYQIGSLGNLYWIVANTTEWNKYYIQTADIDASETSTWFSDGSSGYYGWSPIGNSSTYFTGSYNGQNYKITNLYINRGSSDYIGLFGWVYSPGTLQNIKLQSINVSGNTHVGGLAGQCGNSSTISYCSGGGIVNGGTGGNVGGLVGNLYVSTLSYSYFSGSVTGKNAVGGLVGCNNASITNNCYSTANVTLTGNSEFAGGLVGYSYGSSSIISLSYATGNVTGYAKVGGFIGSNVNYANINDCYATGSATATNWTGGFVGYNNYSYITRAYSKGAVSGVSSSGGLIGTNTGWCYYSFWDNQTSLQSSSTGGISTSTINMKTQSTFTNQSWDFVGETTNGSNDYWNISSTKNNGYPYLNWQAFASVTFEDGSTFSQTLTSGLTNQALGRFSLNGSLAGGSLNSVTIKLDGTRSGASNFKLWSSTDNIFDGSDTQLGATVATDPGDGNTVSFSSLSSSIGTSVDYFFLTCDLTAGADGTIQPIVVDNNSLTLSNADLFGTITNSALTMSTSPLPVELISFSAEVAVSSVVLNWQTATEVNNYGFEVEKSIRNEELGNRNWKKVGFIQGSGNSNSAKEYSYVDKAVTSGNFLYRLKQIDNDGNFEYSKEIEIEVHGLPTEFSLDQNYPNPFNPSTSIQYSIVSSQDVSLKVFNVLGKEVAVLINQKKEPGTYTVDFSGAYLASGIYFYRLQAGEFVQTRKMIVLK